MWKTWQDRLKSELRLAQAKTVEEANAVLETFLRDYNQRFAVPAAEADRDFRPLSKRLNRDRLFSLKYQRTVGQDHVIAFGSRSIQLPAKRGKFGYAGAKVELSHQLNGELVIWLADERLHRMDLALDYAPGRAPRRPQVAKKKQPRIYNYAGRAALAVRP